MIATGAAALAAPPLIAQAQGKAQTFPTMGAIHRFDPEFDRLVAPGAVIEQVVEGLVFSEGPTWVPRDGGYLLFSDPRSNRIHRWSQRDGLSVFLSPSGYAGADVADLFREAGSNGLWYRDGAVYIASCGERGVLKLDLRTKTKVMLADRWDGKRFNTPNDLTMDRRGAIYFTDPTYGFKDRDAAPQREIPFTGIYRLGTDGKVDLLDKPVGSPNGLGLSPDEKTLYATDQMGGWFAYDLAPGGRSVSNRRQFFPRAGLEGRGGPDGIKVSSSGHVWLGGPGGVHVINPAGKRIGWIATGDSTPNLCFAPGYVYMTVNTRIARVKTRARPIPILVRAS